MAFKNIYIYSFEKCFLSVNKHNRLLFSKDEMTNGKLAIYIYTRISFFL